MYTKKNAPFFLFLSSIYLFKDFRITKDYLELTLKEHSNIDIKALLTLFRHVLNHDFYFIENKDRKVRLFCNSNPNYFNQILSLIIEPEYGVIQ